MLGRPGKGTKPTIESLPSLYSKQYMAMFTSKETPKGSCGVRDLTHQ